MLIQIESIAGKKSYINTDQIGEIKEKLFGYKVYLMNREAYTVSAEVFKKIEEAMNK